MKFAPMNQKTIVVQQIFTNILLPAHPFLLDIDLRCRDVVYAGSCQFDRCTLVHGRFPEQHSMFQLLPNKSYHSMQTFAKQILVSILFTLNYFRTLRNPRKPIEIFTPVMFFSNSCLEQHVVHPGSFQSPDRALWCVPRSRLHVAKCHPEVSPIKKISAG